jgi:threonine synthase
VWDVFISHATEDKETFVKGLAQELTQRGLRVWYDEFELNVGDSLRRTIDRGLTESHFGVVVLSPAFFSREWPKKELDALVTREVDGRKIVLPVWLHIERSQVAQSSALLADRVAAKAEDGLLAVADAICKAIRLADPNHSTQIIMSTPPQLKGELSCLVGHSKAIFPMSPNLWSCPGVDPRYSCLAVQYQYDAVKKFPLDAYRGLERFLPLLPLVRVVHTLNEGNTPLLRQNRLNTQLGFPELYLKDEGRNPTGSFKDRKAVINANIAATCGSKRLHCVTSGNAGVAIATYAGALGIASKHYLVNSRRSTKLEGRRMERLGGEVLRDASAWEAVFELPPDLIEYNCTPGYDPIGMEGYKVIAWEIWEQLGRIPDAVVVPVGSGEGLVGVFKGFLELKAMGLITSLPKMVAVEPNECGILSATKELFADPHEISDPRVIWRSHADQLVLQFMPCVRMVLWAIRESHGIHCAVRNEEIEGALDLFISKTGLLIEPSSAVVLAALRRGAARLNLKPGDTIVALLTGRGSDYASETLQFARERKSRLVTTVPVGDSTFNIEVADLTDYKEILPLYNALIEKGEITLSTRPIYVDDEASFFSGLGERECVFIVRDPLTGRLHGYGLLLECRRDLGCSPHIAEVDTYFWPGARLPGVEMALLSEILRYALSKGYRMAVHECRPKDDLSSYLECGFAEKATFNGFYERGTTSDAILLLELASLTTPVSKYQ